MPGFRRNRSNFWARKRSQSEQAFAARRRWNYAVNRVPPLKEPLCLNMDETPVALYQGNAKSTVFVSKKGRQVRALCEPTPLKPPFH